MNVMLIDDHPVIVQALSSFLQKKGINIVNVASNAIEAIYKIRQTKRIDAIILDFYLPDIDGGSLSKRIKAFNDEIKIIMFTSSSTPLTELVNDGIDGFILKSKELENVYHALRLAVNGKKIFTSDVKYRDINLSCRELQVLKLYCEGMRINEIANAMMLSNKTISTYKVRMMKKINAKTDLQLIDAGRLFLNETTKQIT